VNFFVDVVVHRRMIGHLQELLSGSLFARCPRLLRNAKDLRNISKYLSPPVSDDLDANDDGK